jgi:hypothetical protein
MHRRRLGKTQQRTKYQQPRPGIMITKHQSPIVCLRMYRGLLYSCSLNGQVRFYQTQTLSEHPRQEPIFHQMVVHKHYKLHIVNDLVVQYYV